MGSDLVQFKNATSHDANAIAVIHDAAWRATYQGIIPHLHLQRMISRRGPIWWQRQIEQGSQVLLLLFDNMPQGYVSFGRARGAWPWHAGEIFELYMTPTYQGVGLGRQLFSQARKVLKANGFQKLVVWALQDNEMACGFYKGLGGTIAATAPEQYGDVTLMRVAFVWGVNVKSSKA